MCRLRQDSLRVVGVRVVLRIRGRGVLGRWMGGRVGLRVRVRSILLSRSRVNMD